MTEFIQYALLGLGAGAMYVLLAQGVVLTFRGSGVLNLAQAALAMIAAYEFNDLRTADWPLWSAMVVIVSGTAFLGLLIDVILMRALRRASPLARLIGTLGVLSVASSFAVLEWGATPQIVTPIFSLHVVHLLGVNVPSVQLWLLAIAVGVTAALIAIWRFTRAGWIAEAVSESERAAAALGWSPAVVSAATWAAGAALAGLAGILISPITQLDVSELTFLVIPALAATLLGGFRSFGLTLAGGIAVGVAQSLTSNYISIEGAADALPFLVIVAVLVIRGSPLPLRGHVLDRMPSVGIGRVDLRIAGPAFAVVALLLALVSSSAWQAMFATTFAIAIVLLSLVVLVGYAGQLSLGQYAIAGLGALFAARLVAAQGWPFPLALVAGTLGASLVGLIFALPALRTRGVNLAVVTLGLGLATQSVVFDNPSLIGGDEGTNVGSQTFFGVDINPIFHEVRYSLLVFVLFVLSCLAVANLRRSRTGRQLLAVRSNERAAASSGINIFATKLCAFAISGALAGLGGIMIGFTETSLSFTNFDPLSSVNAVAEAVIGGVGFILGALQGAILSPDSLSALITNQSVQNYLPLIGGVGLILTLMANPRGIVAELVSRLRPLADRLRLRPEVAPESFQDSMTAAAVPRTLTVEHLRVRYGGVVAVDDVSLCVQPGQIVALIGPNGAGKTSFMDGLTGFARSTGSVRLDDLEISGLSAHRRARAGLARSWQGLELFEDLTVQENLQAASDHGRQLSFVRDLVRPGRSRLSVSAIAAIRGFALEDSLTRYPEEISYGKRRLVAIARAVATEPSVLLLDEPAAGLDEHESAELAQLVRGLADRQRLAILVVEHDMDFIMGIADQVVVVDFGHQVANGTPAQVSEDAAAIAAYLGEGVGAEMTAAGR